MATGRLIARATAIGSATVLGALVTLAVLSLPAGAVAFASGQGNSYPPGYNFGGLSVDGYCQATFGSTSELLKNATGPNAAYNNWACTNNNLPLNMTTLCEWEYHSLAPNVTIVARTNQPDNAETWQCFAAGSVLPSLSATSLDTPAPIATRLSTPGEAFHSVSRDIQDAVIAGALVLIIAFPANVFNQALSDNYAEIMGIIAAWRRRVRSWFNWLLGPPAVPVAAAVGATAEATPATDATAGAPAADSAPGSVVTGAPPSAPAPTGKTGWGWFLVTLALGAVLGGFLSPAFGFNPSSIEDFLAKMVAFAVSALTGWFVARKLRQYHRYGLDTYLRALPLGLVIALACVLVSRLSGFEPGYLYGVVVSISFYGSLPDRHNAHLVALSAIATLTVAIGAWLLWIPVNHLATGSSTNAVLVVLDDTLASVFAGGLFGTAISLMPLRGLPGGHLSRWRRDAWAAILFLSVFLIIQVELRPASGPSHPGSAGVVTIILLFIVFGALSFGFRGYFNHRHKLAAVAAPSAPVAPPAPEPKDG